jgi:hypothetical protein
MKTEQRQSNNAEPETKTFFISVVRKSVTIITLFGGVIFNYNMCIMSLSEII